MPPDSPRNGTPPVYRKEIKRYCYRDGVIATEVNEKDEKEDKATYQMYFDFNEKVNRIPSHRILAINRAEKENAIKLKIQKPEENIIDFIERDVIKDKNSNYANILEDTVEDSFKRLIEPSVEREIRSDLTEKAEEKAIKVFG